MEFRFKAEKETLLTLAGTGEIFGDLTVQVERGSRDVLDGEGEVTKNQKGFMVSNGTKSGFGSKIETALKAFLKALNYGTIDDFAFDTDSEFFAAAPKVNVDRNNPWAREDADELAELRIAAEGANTAALEDEANAQSHWLAHSTVIKGAFDRLKTKSAVEAWAKGKSEDDSAAPMLSKIGMAPNALREATFMAELSEIQFEFLSTAINRGKAIDLETRKGSVDFYDGAAVAALTAYETVMEGDVERLSIETIELGLEGSLSAMGVDSGDYQDWATGLTLAGTALETKAEKLRSAGVSKHSVGDDEREAMRTIIGMDAVIRQMGDCIRGIAALDVARDMEAGDDKLKALKAAKRDIYGAFVQKLGNAVTKAENERAANAKKAGAAEAAKDGEAFNGAKKAMAELGARELAARVFASFKDHKAYAEVFSEVALMVKAQKALDDLAAAPKAA